MSLATLDNPNVFWDDSIEKILSELGDEAQICAFLHKKAHEYYTTQNIKYQLPIIILSAVSGTGNLISTNFPQYSTIIILSVGVLSIFTSIMSSVAQFLKVSQLSESHRISYLSWEKFHSTIKFQLNKRRVSRENLRDFLSIIVPEYQRLKEISANIPTHICNDIKKNKNNLKNMTIPYMFNGFHPVVPFNEDNTSTEDNDSNVNELINLNNLNINTDVESNV